MRKTLAGRPAPPAPPAPWTPPGYQVVDPPAPKRAKKDEPKITPVPIEELERRLTSWQSTSLRSQMKHGLASVLYDEETEVLTMWTKSGHVVKTGPPKYHAPRFRRLVIASALAVAIWLDASGRVPLSFRGYYAPSTVMDWAVIVGAFVGFMSVWPRRHPKPQKMLSYLTAAAAVFEMGELFEEERHHHSERTRNSVH